MANTLTVSNAGGSGSYSLLAGLLSAPTEDIGNVVTGSFTQSGGTNLSSNIFIGGLGGSGTYSLTSGLLSSNMVEQVGGGGTGNFVQTGGSNSCLIIYFATNGGSRGNYTLSGGVLSAGSENFCPNANGTSVFTQTGGTNSTSSLYLAINGGTATYNLNGGLLNVGSISQGLNYTFNFGGGTLVATALGPPR